MSPIAQSPCSGEGCRSLLRLYAAITNHSHVGQTTQLGQWGWLENRTHTFKHKSKHINSNNNNWIIYVYIYIYIYTYIHNTLHVYLLYIYICMYVLFLRQVRAQPDLFPNEVHNGWVVDLCRNCIELLCWRKFYGNVMEI